MKPGASGNEHADAKAVNASAADFEAILSTQNIPVESGTISLPDDIYTLGLVLRYQADGAEKLEYVEFPDTVSFTILSMQFLSAVNPTE